MRWARLMPGSTRAQNDCRPARRCFETTRLRIRERRRAATLVAIAAAGPREAAQEIRRRTRPPITPMDDAQPLRQPASAAWVALSAQVLICARLWGLSDRTSPDSNTVNELRGASP